MTSNPAPEQATPETVAPEWWSSEQLRRHLGYSRVDNASLWFDRHEKAGHFDAYDSPRAALNVRHSEGADPRGNRWQYWAPACVEIRARSARGSSRLSGE